MSFVSPTCSIHLDPTYFVIDGTAVCPPPTHQNDRNIAWPQLRNQSCAGSTDPVHNACRGSHPIMLSHNPAVTMWILLQCILYIPLDNLRKPLNHPNCVVAWSPPCTIPTAKPPPGLRDPESRLGIVCLGHSSALKVLTPKPCCDMLCKPLLVVQQMKHTAELQTRLLGETIVGLSWHCWMLTVTERSIQPSQHLVKPK